MARHMHYIVQGYRAETTDGGLSDVATIDILVLPGSQPEVKRPADNRRMSPVDLEQYAVEQARERVHKPYYRVANVIEHDDDVCVPNH